MKILMVYATKHGSVSKCTDYISQKVSDIDTSTLNLSKHIDVSDYDKIIIAGSIYIGKIQNKVKKFIKNNYNALMKKDCSLIICCGSESSIDEFVSTNFTNSDKIFNHIYYGGYAYYLDKMNFLERFIVKKVAKVTESKEDIQYENLDQLISTLK